MKPTIYVAHSTKIDFENDIYRPINNALGEQCHLILPHENGKKPEYSLPIIKNSDAVIAFVDGVSEGRALEVGFAVALSCPVAFVHNINQPVTTSAYSFIPGESSEWIEYTNEKELEEKLLTFIGLVKSSKNG